MRGDVFLHFIANFLSCFDPAFRLDTVSNMSPSHKREGPDPEPDAEHDTEFGTEHDAEHDTEFGTVANTEPDAEHDTDAQHRGNSCRWAAGPN